MKVFISHSEDDVEMARMLKNILEKDSNVDEAFIFEDKKKFGSQIEEKITDELDYSNYFVAIITDNSIKSASVHQELGYAQAKNIPKIPMRLEDTAKGFLLHGAENLEFTEKDFKNKCLEVKKFIINNPQRKKFSKEEERIVQNSAHFRFALAEYLEDILDTMLVRLMFVDEEYRDDLHIKRHQNSIFKKFLEFAEKDVDDIMKYFVNHPLDLFHRFNSEYSHDVEKINEILKKYIHDDLFPDERDALEKFKQIIENDYDEESYDIGNHIWKYLPDNAIRHNYHTYNELAKDQPDSDTPITNYLRGTCWRFRDLIKSTIYLKQEFNKTYEKFGDISHKSVYL